MTLGLQIWVLEPVSIKLLEALQETTLLENCEFATSVSTVNAPSRNYVPTEELELVVLKVHN